MIVFPHYIAEQRRGCWIYALQEAVSQEEDPEDIEEEGHWEQAEGGVGVLLEDVIVHILLADCSCLECFQVKRHAHNIVDQNPVLVVVDRYELEGIVDVVVSEEIVLEEAVEEEQEIGQQLNQERVTSTKLYLE